MERVPRKGSEGGPSSDKEKTHPKPETVNIDMWLGKSKYSRDRQSRKDDLILKNSYL